MRIASVVANNRRKAFEVSVAGKMLSFPYSRLEISPTAENPVQRVFVDPELGEEGFTYVLQGGEEESVHVDALLDYNRDPAYLQDLLLYELTLEARQAVDVSDLTMREIIRLMRTSASQVYRLLDPANRSKSIGQMLALLSVLSCDVQVVVKDRIGAAGSARVKRLHA